MSYENKRYKTIEHQRVAAVEEAFFIRAEKLYRPHSIDIGVRYHPDDLPKGKFGSTEAALAAVRETFYTHDRST
jgi:hypothetical protein